MATPRDPPPAPEPARPGAHAETLALYKALFILGYPVKAEKVLECGRASIPHECLDCNAISHLRLSCDHRLCPRCARRRASRFISTHYSAIQRILHPSHLVLTFRTPKYISTAHLARCTQSFVRLRRSKLWRSTVLGGLAGLELTHTDTGWHPHWHALIDNELIPKHALDMAWKKASRGSFITWINRCEPEAGIYEVAKYIAKGSDFYANPHLLEAFLKATHGKRFFTSFGSLYRATDPSHPKIDIPDNPGTLPAEYTTHYGPCLLRHCHACGSTHLTRLPKEVDRPIPKPYVQFPF